MPLSVRRNEGKPLSSCQLAPQDATEGGFPALLITTRPAEKLAHGSPCIRLHVYGMIQSRSVPSCLPMRRNKRPYRHPYPTHLPGDLATLGLDSTENPRVPPLFRQGYESDLPISQLFVTDSDKSPYHSLTPDVTGAISRSGTKRLLPTSPFAVLQNPKDAARQSWRLRSLSLERSTVSVLEAAFVFSEPALVDRARGRTCICDPQEGTQRIAVLHCTTGPDSAFGSPLLL